jgi:hypothetical protein
VNETALVSSQYGMQIHLFVHRFSFHGFESLKTMNFVSYFTFPSEVQLPENVKVLTEFFFPLAAIEIFVSIS